METEKQYKSEHVQDADCIRDISVFGEEYMIFADIRTKTENDSFDYAGTHCTNGLAGTCKLPDRVTIDTVELLRVEKFNPDLGDYQLVSDEIFNMVEKYVNELSDPEDIC